MRIAEGPRRKVLLGMAVEILRDANGASLRMTTGAGLLSVRTDGV